MKSREELGDICSEFENMGVDLRLGENYLENMETFDIIFRSPSLRPDLPQLLKARQEGTYITSEDRRICQILPCESHRRHRERWKNNNYQCNI